MKWLIVNADDFGISSRRNAGILEAHCRGIVTSASMIAYAPAFREAVKMAKAVPKLDIGLHLNLSEGEPLVLGHKSLVGPDGRFWGKDEARRRARENQLYNDEVERETSAQIETLIRAGLKVTHIDGHHHIHVYGSLAAPIAKAAAAHGIRAFRSPADRLIPTSPLPPERLAQIEDYRQAAQKSTPVFAGSRMRSTEHFGGIGLSGRLNTETLIEALRALPDGLTEIMVHPGMAESPDGFEGPPREEEVKALTDPRIRPLLKELSISLTHFGNL